MSVPIMCGPDEGTVLEASPPLRWSQGGSGSALSLSPTALCFGHVLFTTFVFISKSYKVLLGFGGISESPAKYVLVLLLIFMLAPPERFTVPSSPIALTGCCFWCCCCCRAIRASLRRAALSEGVTCKAGEEAVTLANAAELNEAPAAAGMKFDAEARGDERFAAWE